MACCAHHRASRCPNDPLAHLLPSPDDIRALLGGGPTAGGHAEGEAAEFEAWLRSEALLGAESSLAQASSHEANQVGQKGRGGTKGSGP